MTYRCIHCGRTNMVGAMCECRRVFKQQAVAQCAKNREHHEQLLQDAREKEMASLSCPDCARLAQAMPLVEAAEEYKKAITDETCSTYQRMVARDGFVAAALALNLEVPT